MLNPITAGRGLIAVAAAGALVVGLQAGAGASPALKARDPLTPRTHFAMKADGSSGLKKSGEAIPNIDSVKATIRTYYGAASDGIADKTKSPYITEVAEAAQRPAALPRPEQDRQAGDRAGHRRHHALDLRHGGRGDALQLRPDPPEHLGAGPAVPGRPRAWSTSSTRPRKLGYTVFGVTGRNDDQKTATLANLTKVGYGTNFTADKFFTKWTGKPAAPSRRTSRAPRRAARRSSTRRGTRAHIEALGYNIVLNVGDQWSDLRAGTPRRCSSCPTRPTTCRARTCPASREPSSCRARCSRWSPTARAARRGRRGHPEHRLGEGHDPRLLQRARRHRGQAQVALHHRDEEAPRQVGPAAEEPVRHPERALGNKPAVVFDADDTTLWTYDMEDAAMDFNFDPALQDEWVQDKRFPAVPGMKRVVKAAKRAGCKVFGLTGRGADQRKAHPEEPAQVLRRRVPLEALLHQVGRRRAAGVRHLRGEGRVHARGVQVADPRARREEVRGEDHRELR